MKQNIKWIVYDINDNSFLYIQEFESYTTNRHWYKLDDIGTDNVTQFDTEKEAWENAGTYCTVIPVRFN